jgi:hypothetical protein
MTRISPPARLVVYVGSNLLFLGDNTIAEFVMPLYVMSVLAKE